MTPSLLLVLALQTPAADPAGAADLFERVRTALFARQGPDGVVYGAERLDPLLWVQSTHLLEGPSHERALLVLDELAAADLDALGASALDRALLQRDLAGVLTWAAGKGARHAGGPPLATRLARSMRDLALAPEEIAVLPDNLAQAAASGAFAAEPDLAGGAPFVPADLLDDEGPWVLVQGGIEGPPAPQHAFAFPFSAFSVHLFVPGGREAGLAYLDAVRGTLYLAPEPDGRWPALPRFPRLTRWALVRRMIVLDRELAPVVTPLVESLQIRTYLAGPPAPDEPPPQADPNQLLQELVLDRRALRAGEAGGLRAHGPDFPFVQFASHGIDPFDRPDELRAPSLAATDTCIFCHADPGVASVRSLVGRLGQPRVLTPRPSSLVDTDQRTLQDLRSRFVYGYLRGATESAGR